MFTNRLFEALSESQDAKNVSQNVVPVQLQGKQQPEKIIKEAKFLSVFKLIYGCA